MVQCHEDAMRIMLVAKNDWANVGYGFAESLKSIGLDATMVMQSGSVYGYPKQGKRVKTIQALRGYASHADIIQFMHSRFIDVGINDLSTKRVFVFHGGGKYRENHESINEFFNPIVEKTLIQTGDLFNLGAKNEVWVLPAVDTGTIRPVYNDNDKLIVGHFPTSGKKKGSDVIISVLNDLSKMDEFKDKFEFRHSGIDNRVSWQEQMHRIAPCDIYIDQMKLGEWGMVALEAAALGKIVISAFNSYYRYMTEYGYCPMMIFRNADQLRHIIINLLRTDRSIIRMSQRSHRTWVETQHSYEVTGMRLAEKVYGIYPKTGG